MNDESENEIISTPLKNPIDHFKPLMEFQFNIVVCKSVINLYYWKNKVDP